jgi:hypothetical protein
MRRDPGKALAVEYPRPLVWSVETGHEIEERGLSGAVGTNEPSDTAPLDFEALDIEGEKTAKGSPHPFHNKDGIGLRHPRFGSYACQ